MFSRGLFRSNPSLSPKRATSSQCRPQRSPYLGEASNDATFAVEGSAGFAWKPSVGVLTYTLLELNLEQNDDFDNDYALGWGAGIGAFVRLPANLQFGLTGRYSQFGAGDVFLRREAAVELRHTLSSRNQLEFVLSRREAERGLQKEGSLAWRHYF